MASSKAARRDDTSEASMPRADRLEAISGYLSDPAAAEFDRLVYERIRLGIMSALAVNRSLSFSDLRSMLKTSDGNLSAHARKLEEADYLTCKKSFKGRLPRTEYRLTPAGRKALESYLDHMEALIHATRADSS